VCVCVCVCVCIRTYCIPTLIDMHPMCILTCKENHYPANNAAMDQVKHPSVDRGWFTSKDGNYRLHNVCVCVVDEVCEGMKRSMTKVLSFIDAKHTTLIYIIHFVPHIAWCSGKCCSSMGKCKHFLQSLLRTVHTVDIYRKSHCEHNTNGIYNRCPFTYLSEMCNYYVIYLGIKFSKIIYTLGI